MKKSLFAFCMLMPSLVFAQVVNGDFSNGTANWVWKRGVSESGIEPCISTQYTPNNIDVPDIGTTPASGRVARLSGPAEYRNGIWYICGQIEQSVAIPSGTQLIFDVKIGEPSSNFPPGRVAYFTVTVVSNNVAHTVATSYGSNVSSPCVQCPSFHRLNVDCPRMGGFKPPASAGSLERVVVA